MEVEFPAGMASRFFVTDPKKGVAIISNFYTIIAKTKLTNKILAVAGEAVWNLPLKNNIMRLFIQKAEAQIIENFLECLAVDQKTQQIFGIPDRMLIIAEGIEKQCLLSMKALKLRGYRMPLAVNVAGLRAGDKLFQIKEVLKENFLYESTEVMVFKPGSRFSVVSGLHRTIFSTEKSTKDLLKMNPSLATGLSEFGPVTPQSFQDEGSYN